MAKKDEWHSDPNISGQRNFAPASSQDRPEGDIVFHEDFMNFNSNYTTGMSGVIWPISKQRNLKAPSYQKYKQASYDLVVEDIPLSAHSVVRYVIFPASDTTVIPMDLYSNSLTKKPSDGLVVQEAVYFLQSKNTKSLLFTGYRTNVKLDLVIWDFERFTREGGIYGGGARKFRIDGAVLLDPNRPDQNFQSRPLVCLLGMDFLLKYPYLLFVPKLDHRGEVDFVLAGNPLVYRPYSIYTEVSKELIIYISARYNGETGKIGCGVFFKSGSIFNLFSGVSKYDENGDEHKEQLWERGVLMGVIKALHVIMEFPVGHELTDVVIRTGSPPINSLLSQMLDPSDDLYCGQTNGKRGDIVDDVFLCHSPHRDLATYIYQLLRKTSGIRVRFECFSTNENYEPVEAAGLLAAAGAEMEEFRIRREDTSIGAYNPSDYSMNKIRSQKQKKSQNITLLEQHDGFRGNSIFVCLGNDGYFLISKRRAQEAMKAADQKTSSILSREDAVHSLGYAPWEGEDAATPNGSFDEENYEFHKPSQRSDFRTLGGILGEAAVRKLKECLKETPKLNPEIILEIIKHSNRRVKVHEFLSMQMKEYRDEYMKSLEHEGLEKGWHFCKDKNWNGYLRRNTRLYNRERWMRVKGEKQMDDGIFSLSGKKWDLSHWEDGKDTSNQQQADKIARSQIESELVDMRRRMGGWPVISEHTGSHGKGQLKEKTGWGKLEADFGFRAFDSGRSGDKHTGDNRFKPELANPKNFKNSDTGDGPDTRTTREPYSGIGARVVARRRYASALDVTDTSESDSTYNSKNMEDSDDHTSEDWVDSEECTDARELMDDSDGSCSFSPIQPTQTKKNQGIETIRSNSNFNQKENIRKISVRFEGDHGCEKGKDKHISYPRPCQNPASVIISGGVTLTAKRSPTKEGLCQDPRFILQKWKDQFSDKAASKTKGSSIEDSSLFNQHQQYPLTTQNTLDIPLCNPTAPRKSNGAKVNGLQALGIEDKWPSFDWMLENSFQEESPTACA